MALERWDRGKWDSAHWDGQLSLTAAVGAIVIAAPDATLSLGSVLAVQSGAVVITAPSATLIVKTGLTLLAQPGDIVITGHDAALTYAEGTGDIVLVADAAGEVIISGQQATMRTKRALPQRERYGRTVHVIQGRW